MNRITKSVPSTASDDLLRDCHRVLFPVVANLQGDAWLERLLAAGTCAVILGESRDEYVARQMSADRRRVETADQISVFVAAIKEQAGEDLLVAVDQEPWGIQRLHDLVPSSPGPAAVVRLRAEDIRENAREVATAARACGVSLFLSPVLDVLTGPNPWLEGRTLRAPTAVVASVASAFVTGVQEAGVAAVAKHFPGFPSLEKDPALHQDITVPGGHWDERSLEPFESVVRAGVAGIMVGPAIVEDVDKAEPASTSGAVIDMLRSRLDFSGLVVSDDLDAPATLNGRTLTATMIDSLRAGADLLLVGGGEHLLSAVETIHQTAVDDPGFAARVHTAADRVRATARTFTAAPSV